MKPALLTLSAQVPYNDSSLYDGSCLGGKTRAVGESASVTDEKPARDSAGLCGLVE